MGPHPLAPVVLTDTKFSRYSLLNKRTARSDDGQMALKMTVNRQAIWGMETTEDNGPEMEWGGAEQEESIRGGSRRRGGENLAREEKVAVNLSAKRDGSEYRDFISSEDTADEDWVMVDISELALM